MKHAPPTPEPPPEVEAQPDDGSALLDALDAALRRMDAVPHEMKLPVVEAEVVAAAIAANEDPWQRQRRTNAARVAGGYDSDFAARRAELERAAAEIRFEEQQWLDTQQRYRDLRDELVLARHAVEWLTSYLPDRREYLGALAEMTFSTIARDGVDQITRARFQELATTRAVIAELPDAIERARRDLADVERRLAEFCLEHNGPAGAAATPQEPALR